MKFILFIGLVLITGCASKGTLVRIQENSENCVSLGFISEAGKTEEAALEHAKEKVFELGGNVLVPNANGALELGFGHTPNKPTTYYVTYNGHAFNCSKNT